MSKDLANILTERYPKGTILDARVQIIKPHVSFLTLDDGTPGIIRNRDLSWNKEIDHPKELLSVGQVVSAMVLGVDGHYQPPRLELSLRQAEHDPWSTVSQKYKLGQTVRSSVCGLVRSGVFIELEPSVNGFIPIRELSFPPPDEVDQVLWIGDTILAEITRIDLSERQIDLSLKQYLMKLERQHDKALQQEFLTSDRTLSVPMIELLNPEQRLDLMNYFKDRHPASDQQDNPENYAGSTLVERIPRILVVDNDPSFRHSLQRLLARLGHHVGICESAEKALNLCSEESFDLVIMDYEFPSGNLDGIQATHQLVAAYPQLPILLVTGANWQVNYRNINSRSRSSGARGLLTKPLEFGRLQTALIAIADGLEDWPDSKDNSPHTADVESPRPFMFPGKGLLYSINKELLRLLKDTHAESCVLFHMNPTTRRMDVFAHQGKPLTRYENVKYRLDASPVADVILDGKTIYESDTTRHQQKFQYLNILDYSSCLGLPVKGFGACEYGLFLFHSYIAHFTRDHLKLAESAAHFLAALIARRESETAIQKMQPLTFAGQLGAHLVHELNNRLATVLNDTEMLALDTGLAESESSNRNPDDPQTSVHPLAHIADPIRLSVIRNCVLSLQQNANAMRRIMQLYLGLVGPEQLIPVNLNDVIQRAVKLLTPVADSHGVKILTDLDKNLPVTLAVSVRLEQVCVNIILNAIQNMHQAKGGGELLIKSKFAGHNSERPLQLRFTDNGQGIHHQLSERIFDLGFTTRQNGGGYGLFITRGLLESMGGAVTVEETVMLVGSTFLIELPLVVPFIEGKFDA